MVRCRVLGCCVCFLKNIRGLLYGLKATSYVHSIISAQSSSWRLVHYILLHVIDTLVLDIYICILLLYMTNSIFFGVYILGLPLSSIFPYLYFMVCPSSFKGQLLRQYHHCTAIWVTQVLVVVNTSCIGASIMCFLICDNLLCIHYNFYSISRIIVLH